MKIKYIPKDFEQKIYQEWEKKGYFKPDYNKKDSYCIMLPPPNITGYLHIGHAFQHTIMDILIRYNRMLGKNTLWQFGTDHAGIATQIIMERKFFHKQNIFNKKDYHKFLLHQTWKWKEKYKRKIIYQMKRLGNSLDWSRERFTMDSQISNAVKEVFIQLYKENLIYKGEKIVNWDPKLRTAISDLEVNNKTSKGFLWYFKYPLANNKLINNGLNYIVVATTRPETMLGDVAIAINPQDIRYKNLINHYVIQPITNKIIPIISDNSVEIDKGTGCVKITPAHDFKDYEIGKRHSLPMINIFTVDGKIRQEAEIFNINNNIFDDQLKHIPIEFRGLDRFEARNKIIKECKKLNILLDVKKHNLILPYGDRSGVIIEPMVTKQWFLRISSLSKKAINIVKTGKIKFLSQQYENMYFSWMKNIQDWCISRQLWWGHRIPVWYDLQGNIYVGKDEIEIRNNFKLKNDYILYQDNDVLDTWFSSSIWTFSTLGWPSKTNDLKIFHPTDVIVSGFDIIFFWISRMIMLTMHFIKDKDNFSQIPFKICYITGLVRDENGLKMSKSKGNIIDPIDIIDGISFSSLINKRTKHIINSQHIQQIQKNTEKKFFNGIKSYGADALRFTLSSLSSTGRDIVWDMNRLNGYSNFCNKLWNASRFIIIHTKNNNLNYFNDGKKLSLYDHWITYEFNQTIINFRKSLDNYRFDIAANIIYEFVWNKFCDWYLEFSKYIINNGNIFEKKGTYYTLITIMESLLRLAHPIIPFITEKIWLELKNITGINSDTIMLQPFPEINNNYIKSNYIYEFQIIKDIVVTIRYLITKKKIFNHKSITFFLKTNNVNISNIIEKNKSYIEYVLRVKNILLLTNQKIFTLTSKIIHEIEVILPIDNNTVSNKKYELSRLSKELIYINNFIFNINKQLSNRNFIDKAPKEIIQKEYDKLNNFKKIKQKLLYQQLILLNNY